MNITYTRNGDYLIPNIIIRKTKPIGHYGRLRKAYLEMHRPIPVSYTHLDVYKRQCRGRGNVPSCAVQNQEGKEVPP